MEEIARAMAGPAKGGLQYKNSAPISLGIYEFM